MPQETLGECAGVGGGDDLDSRRCSAAAPARAPDGGDHEAQTAAAAAVAPISEDGENSHRPPAGNRRARRRAPSPPAPRRSDRREARPVPVSPTRARWRRARQMPADFGGHRREVRLLRRVQRHRLVHALQEVGQRAPSVRERIDPVRRCSRRARSASVGQDPLHHARSPPRARLGAVAESRRPCHNAVRDLVEVRAARRCGDGSRPGAARASCSSRRIVMSAAVAAASGIEGRRRPARRHLAMDVVAVRSRRELRSVSSGRSSTDGSRVSSRTAKAPAALAIRPLPGGAERRRRESPFTA